MAEVTSKIITKLRGTIIMKLIIGVHMTPRRITTLPGRKTLKTTILRDRIRTNNPKINNMIKIIEETIKIRNNIVITEIITPQKDITMVKMMTTMTKIKNMIMGMKINMMTTNRASSIIRKIVKFQKRKNKRRLNPIIRRNRRKTRMDKWNKKPRLRHKKIKRRKKWSRRKRKAFHHRNKILK